MNNICDIMPGNIISYGTIWNQFAYGKLKSTFDICDIIGFSITGIFS